MSSQNTPLVSHICLVYTAAGVSIEIHISLTLFTQVKCVARSQCAAEGAGHVDVCLTLLAQLITLLGIDDLLQGELALEGFAFCLWR